jgi:heme-degrading monooxygenase HmoA
MYLNNENSYYAVIFTSVRTSGDHGYSLMATKMVELAKIQDGFLGVDSAREDVGITVSYWQSLETIKKWKEQIDHTLARKLGREEWYSSYTVRICKVIREYSFNR